MCKCVDSILEGGDDVEIIIVNDGSRDNTLDIANGYAKKFPSIVKVIDKPNGGHGSGVNAGMKAATGMYYKVVDSDDWLDKQSLLKLLDTIKRHMAEGTLPDLYITNFIYDKVYLNEQHQSAYKKMMPEGKIIGWEHIKGFHFSHMLLMHSILYKRERLLESGTVLPEHTFYVDNLYAYQPLPCMKTLYYLNVDLYHYFIGRADQSVTISNMVVRYEQQIRVMRCMIDAYTWAEIKKMPKGLKKYMWHALNAIMVNTLFFTCAEDSPARRQALGEMWAHIKERDIALYKKLRRRSYTSLVNYLPWKLRGWVLVHGYHILCRKVKLG
jgi:glycosyltransferase involved in cell wall biosynthesis